MRTAVGYTCGYVVYEGKNSCFYLRKVGSEEFEKIYYKSLQEAMQAGRWLTGDRKAPPPLPKAEENESIARRAALEHVWAWLLKEK